MNFSTDLFLEYKKRPERAALARLLERHQDAVYTLCYQVLRHPQDAEDACQEVLLEVSRQVDSVEEPERFSAWLYRTAIHTALDVRRKRGRQRVRDAGARRATGAGAESPEATEALHQGLAGLDDVSRTLVVEHYFARRPLRELAAERGCSEVAVWKRIQNAKERLKKSLGSAAVSALEGISNVPAPAGILPKVLGLSGGLAMATKAGIKVAIVAPLLLLGGVGAVLVARRSEPPPPPILEVRKLVAAKRTAAPAPPDIAASTAPPPVLPGPPAPRIRKPYPFKDPTLGRPAAAVRTELTLYSSRVTIDFSNVSFEVILNHLREVTGLTFVAGADVQGEMISFKVHQIVCDGALRLMLQPRGLNYEILEDGTVRIDLAEKIQGSQGKAGGGAIAHLVEMRWIEEELDKGWDGISGDDPTARLETALQKKRIVATQGETTLEVELKRVRELGIPVHVEGQTIELVGGTVRHEKRRTKPFLQVVTERSLQEHVQELARTQGMVAVAINGMVIFTSEQNAASYRAKVDEPRRAQDRLLETLQKPVESSATSDVPGFLDAAGRSHGLTIVPTEAAWNSPATLSISAGTTLRQALDQLKVHGFRWAVRDGKLYVLK